MGWHARLCVGEAGARARVLGQAARAVADPLVPRYANPPCLCRRLPTSSSTWTACCWTQVRPFHSSALSSSSSAAAAVKHPGGIPMHAKHPLHHYPVAEHFYTVVQQNILQRFGKEFTWELKASVGPWCCGGQGGG